MPCQCGITELAKLWPSSVAPEGTGRRAMDCTPVTNVSLRAPRRGTLALHGAGDDGLRTTQGAGVLILIRINYTINWWFLLPFKENLNYGKVMIALEFRDKVSCIFESDTRVPTRSLQCQGDSSAGNIPIVNIYSYPYVATAHAHTLTQQCPVLYCLHICDTVVINDYAVARRLSDTEPLSNQMLIFFDNPKNTFWWEEVGMKTQLVGVLKLCPVLDIFFKYGISQYTVYHMHVPRFPPYKIISHVYLPDVAAA